MRTDQLGQRLKISAELTFVRFKWQVITLVQLTGFAILLAGAFLYFRRFVRDLRGVGPALEQLPQSYFVQEPLGNILLIAIGAALVYRYS